MLPPPLTTTCPALAPSAAFHTQPRRDVFPHTCVTFPCAERGEQRDQGDAGRGAPRAPLYRLTAKGGSSDPVVCQQPDDGKGKAKKASKSKAKKRDDSDEVRESGTRVQGVVLRPGKRRRRAATAG